MAVVRDNLKMSPEEFLTGAKIQPYATENAFITLSFSPFNLAQGG